MKYQESHPWIRFSLNLSTLDYPMWLQFGEASSKCDHLAGVPLRPEVANELHKIYLTKGVLATTAIEGNTLSEEQVRQQVDGHLKLPPSQQYLQQETQNIIDVCNEEVRAQLGPPGGKMPLCVDLIKSYNRRVLKNLEVDADVVPGGIRHHSVVVGNVYRGAPAEDCEVLLERLCTWLNSADFTPPREDLRVPLALIKAVLAHVYLAWIHPFGDGNGRTARLVEFHLLFSSGIPLPASHLLSDHYNRTRAQYYRELDKASKSGGDLIPFLRYATQGFIDGLRDQIRIIRDQQLKVTWENYVHSLFQDHQPSPTQKRRRSLVLELTQHHGWIDLAKIDDINPRITKMYLQAGDRMLQRDLNAVSTMGLIERKYGKVRARRELIEAFLPRKVAPIPLPDQS